MDIFSTLFATSLGSDVSKIWAPVTLPSQASSGNDAYETAIASLPISPPFVLAHTYVSNTTSSSWNVRTIFIANSAVSVEMQMDRSGQYTLTPQLRNNILNLYGKKGAWRKFNAIYPLT